VSSSSSSDVGGLIGLNKNGSVSNSSATGDVSSSSSSDVGGLIGLNKDSVSDSSATGDVSSSTGDGVGGLIGSGVFSGGTALNSYATGNVSGDENVGGLAGKSIRVTDSFATGNVSGNENVGGLIGSDGSGPNGYWDTEATGQSSSSGGSDITGLTTSEMQGSSASTNMGGFDFTNTWNTVPSEYPVLDSFDTQKQIEDR
jgi:hypothetical protein